MAISSPFPKLKAALIAGLAALLSACSPVAVLNHFVSRAGYSAHTGIAYGADPRQKLDIYVPDGLTAPAPVMLFFYGGSWEAGHRGDYLALGQAFATKGVITVVADYRLYPQVHYPAFVQDGAAALVFLHSHVAQYQGDPGRIFVAGHSAGAYNAVMLASDPQFVKAAGGRMDWIAGAIGIAGPYDFLPLTDPKLIDMFGGAHNPAMLPITYIDGPRPPMLLAAGSADSVVGPANADRMAVRLRAHGDQVVVRHYPGVGHIGIIVSLLPGFRGRTTLRQDVLDFIHAH